MAFTKNAGKNFKRTPLKCKPLERRLAVGFRSSGESMHQRRCNALAPIWRDAFRMPALFAPLKQEMASVTNLSLRPQNTAEITPGTCNTTWYGFPCFYGRDHPKAHMQRHATTLKRQVLQLQVIKSYRNKADASTELCYGHSFVLIPNIEQNIHKLINLSRVQIPRASNHVYEIIVKDQPCKIVMDFDQSEGFPADAFIDRNDFCHQVECALTEIMLQDFGVRLTASSFVWLFTDYSYKPKFSAHLVIHHEMPDGSLLVLPCHKHTPKHDGSRHFLKRLIQVLPKIEKVKDFSIYSDDRAMRMPLACKPNEQQLQGWKPGTLEFADPDTPYTHGMVTYFDGKPLHVLQMPTVEQSSNTKKKSLQTDKSTLPNHLTLSDAEQRMFELLRMKHPTVYLMHPGNVFDRAEPPRFNHKDRDEVCWCGKAHDSNDYSAWFCGNVAWALCWATNKTFRIGFLEDDFADPTDIEVKMRYMSWRDPGPLNDAVCYLLRGEGATLGIQSPMGTGKTFMLLELIEELESVLNRPARICVITYRTTLALNVEAALDGLGFVNYLDVKGTNKLPEAEKCIVQLDSIGMILQRGRVIPQYDLLILDEFESTLHHTTAKTHGEKQRATFDTFCSTIKHAHRVFVADALLGRESRMFLRALGKQTRIVRNAWRDKKPRTFCFTHDQDDWLKSLVGKLRCGENCAIASMSASKLHVLKDFLVANKILKSDEILLYDAQTDDEIKKRVRQVNEDWVRFRLVMWSPAVESGVDFNVSHFHGMFVILCSNSTVAMGALQSTGRIRHLRDLHIMCLCQPGLSLDIEQPEMRPEEAVEQLRWHQGLLQHQRLANFEANILSLGEETLANGDVALLPEHDTPGMVVVSHNLARIINSRECLLPEFIKLLEQQGHQWYMKTNMQRKKARPLYKVPMGVYDKGNEMLEAPVITSNQELTDLLLRQSHYQLTRKEKWMLARHYFCVHHHIRNKSLDAAFLARHPADDAEANRLHVLLSALGHNPDWPLKTQVRLLDDGSELTTPVQARGKVLREILQALCVDNLLNCPSIILTPDKVAALQKCTAFTHAKEIERLFEINSRSSQDFESAKDGKIATRLQALFERTGVHCSTKSSRTKDGNRSRAYTLDFVTDKKHAKKDNKEHEAQRTAMANLVKLAAGLDGHGVWANKTVYDFVQQLPLGNYAKYERTAETTVIGFDEDGF